MKETAGLPTVCLACDNGFPRANRNMANGSNVGTRRSICGVYVSGCGLQATKDENGSSYSGYTIAFQVKSVFWHVSMLFIPSHPIPYYTTYITTTDSAQTEGQTRPVSRISFPPLFFRSPAFFFFFNTQENNAVTNGDRNGDNDVNNTTLSLSLSRAIRTKCPHARKECVMHQQ